MRISHLLLLEKRMPHLGPLTFQDQMEQFYQQLQKIIDQTSKKNILIVKGGWNVKVGKDAQADLGIICGPYCNDETTERGLRLLEFATFNSLVMKKKLVPHKPSRRWKWHSPDGKHHKQIDYIWVRKRFCSGVITSTRQGAFLEQI